MPTIGNRWHTWYKGTLQSTQLGLSTIHMLFACHCLEFSAPQLPCNNNETRKNIQMLTDSHCPCNTGWEGWKGDQRWSRPHWKKRKERWTRSKRWNRTTRLRCTVPSRCWRLTYPRMWMETAGASEGNCFITYLNWLVYCVFNWQKFYLKNIGLWFVCNYDTSSYVNWYQ